MLYILPVPWVLFTEDKRLLQADPEMKEAEEKGALTNWMCIETFGENCWNTELIWDVLFSHLRSPKASTLPSTCEVGRGAPLDWWTIGQFGLFESTESTWFLGLHEVLHVQLHRTAYGELLCASRLSKVLKGQTLWVHIFCSRKPSTGPGREGCVGSQSACSDSHPIECECRNCARQHLAKSRWKNAVIFYFPWCLSLSLSQLYKHIV